MALINKNLRRGIELYIDGKKVQANMRQVEAEAKRLREEIRGMTVGSDEYVKATEKYRNLNKVLREHKAELQGVEIQQQSMLNRGVQLFKDYSLQITGAMAALTGVAIKLQNFRKQAAEKEDSAANLKALTGLDDSNIQWLTSQADKLSTTMESSGLRVRKSATEILEAYMLVGSAKPELLQNKEALNAVTIEAMRLAEAAKMELKDAVDAVTISLNQFDAGADQAARFTNVLAAGSKFGAANVQDQAAAIKNAGVAAAGAGLTIEQLVGIIEMLGEKGIKAEEAGTALKGVFLKLQTGADDTNPAIVGLDKALENLAAKGLSAGEILKMFDRRGYNAAKILIDNTEKVKEYTKAVTDTNIAVEQAAINSDTAAAKMAQVRNQVNLTGQELAKTLAPVFSMTVGWTRKFVMAMPALIDFLKKYGTSMTALITTLILYNSYTKISTGITSAWSSAVTFAKTQISSLNAIMVAYRTVLTGSTTAQVEMTAAMKGTNIVTQIAAVGIGVLRAAYYALSLQLTACARTLHSLKTVLAESGMGLFILAIGAAVSAVIHYDEKMKEAKRVANEQREAQKALYKEYDEAAARIRNLRKVANDHTVSLNDRRKAIEELQKLAPDYQASINEEGTLIESNTEKLDEYLKRLKASIVLEAYKAKMSELLQKQIEAEEDQQKATDEYWSVRQKNTLQGYDRNSLSSRLSRLFGMESEYNLKKAKDKADNTLQDINKEIDATEQRMKGLADEFGLSLVDEKTEGTSSDDTTEPTSPTEETKSDKDTKTKKKIREKLEAIDAEYNNRAAALKQQYIDGEIKTEQDYSMRLQQIEMDRLKAKMKVAGLDEKQTSEFLQRIKDMELSIRKRIEDMTKTSAKDTVEANLDALQKEYDASKEYLKKAYDNGIIPTEERYKEYLLALENNFNLRRKELLEKQADERLADLRTREEAELQEIKLQHAQRLITEEEYEEALLAIREKYAQKRSAVENKSSRASKTTARENKEVLIEIEAQKNSKFIALDKKRTEEIERLNEETRSMFLDAINDMGEALGEMVTGEKDAMKEFAKDLLVNTLNMMQKMLMMQLTFELGMALLKGGILGFAKAAAKILIVQMVFGSLKGLVKSFDTGGFTSNGRWDEPQGIVHSNEFVANRHAVNNPQVLPVLQLIDAAQRSGSISNLTGKDIAAVATGFAPSSKPTIAASSNNVQTQTIDLGPLCATLGRLEKVMDRATEAYKEPSPAYCYVNGKGGINEAQKLNETINKNASFK